MRRHMRRTHYLRSFGRPDIRWFLASGGAGAVHARPCGRVGVTSSTLFAMPQAMTTPRPAGFILGYASLTVAQIQQGIETLGAMLFTVSSSRT